MSFCLNEHLESKVLSMFKLVPNQKIDSGKLIAFLVC